MKLFKRALAGILTACTVLTTCTACGENTAVAMTIDGTEIPAGIYLYYIASAYSDAMNVIEEKDSDAFTECETTQDVKKIMKVSDIDDVHADVWIQNKAIEYCQSYVAVQKEFEALNLTLSGSDLASIDSAVATSYSYYGDFFNNNGIGEASVKKIMTLSYQQNAIYDAYYGEGGSEDIQDEDLKKYYTDNHLRAKYITMPLKDGEGNLLKADGKKEIENMANDFLKRLEKKSKDEAALMEEFDYLIEENNNYVTSLSEAAITTTDENGSNITTPTTAKVTTQDDDKKATTTAPTSKKDDEATTAGAETTTAPADGEETTEGDNEETTTTVTTTVTATTEATTTTTTVVGLGYSTENENIIVVSTTSAEEEKTEETTAEPSYSPSKSVYEWIADEKTPLNKPTLIKDDETYYIVMKMDINDRMTEDDLWSYSQKDNVRYELYHEPFMDSMEEKGKALPVDRNNKAFRRYSVLDVDVKEYQNALMQSYYDYYSNYGGY